MSAIAYHRVAVIVDGRRSRSDPLLLELEALPTGAPRPVVIELGHGLAIEGWCLGGDCWNWLLVARDELFEHDVQGRMGSRACN